MDTILTEKIVNGVRLSTKDSVRNLLFDGVNPELADEAKRILRLFETLDSKNVFCLTENKFIKALRPYGIHEKDADENQFKNGRWKKIALTPSSVIYELKESFNGFKMLVAVSNNPNETPNRVFVKSIGEDIKETFEVWQRRMKKQGATEFKPYKTTTIAYGINPRTRKHTVFGTYDRHQGESFGALGKAPQFGESLIESTVTLKLVNYDTSVLKQFLKQNKIESKVEEKSKVDDVTVKTVKFTGSKKSLTDLVDRFFSEDEKKLILECVTEMQTKSDVRLIKPNVIDLHKNYVVVLDLDGYIIGYGNDQKILKAIEKETPGTEWHYNGVQGHENSKMVLTTKDKFSEFKLDLGKLNLTRY
jgi:hypothetical protein